jgi:Rrf2 family protein
MLSKACQYAIKATIIIARQSQLDQHVSLKSVAKEIKTPVAFTAKILQRLAREGCIQSVKGQEGGYKIPKSKLSKLTLIQIVKAIDGDSIYTSCILGLAQCSEQHPCPVHGSFKVIRGRFRNMLESTRIVSLAKELDEGSTFLKK